MDFWAAIAKIGALVVILTPLFKLIHWWRTPAHRLEAFVGWNFFKLPPQVQAEFAAQAESINRITTKFQDEHPKRETDETAYWDIRTLATEIRYGVKADLSSDLRYLHGCWVATVKNTGKKNVWTLIFDYPTPQRPAFVTTEKQIHTQLISPR